MTKPFCLQVVSSVFNSTPLENNPLASPSKRRSKGPRAADKKDDQNESKQLMLQALVAVITQKETPAFLQFKLLEILSKLNNKVTYLNQDLFVLIGFHFYNHW